jgi:ParB family chromosome partitioning protein
MSDPKVKSIPINEIDLSILNARKGDYHEGLEDLAESIKAHGLLQPVVVFRKGNRYKLIIGQRRFHACKDILGFREIDARVIAEPDDTDATVLSFTENIHRLDLDYRDKMTVATALLTKLGSIREVAKRINVKEATVRNYLGYAGVPEPLKELVSRKKISARTAMDIANNISDEKEALAIAKTIVETPSGDRRRAIIEVARANPGKSAAEIGKLASKQKFKEITLHLTPKVSEALEVACKDFSSEPADLAIAALEGWLKVQKFLP